MSSDNEKILLQLKSSLTESMSKIKYSFDSGTDDANLEKQYRAYIEKEIRDYLGPGDYKINIFSSRDPENSHVIRFSAEIIQTVTVLDVITGEESNHG